MTGAAAAGPADEVMFVLKPADWEGARDCVVKAIGEVPKAPWVCFGWDRPDHFRFMKTGELDAAGGGIEAIQQAALERVRAARTHIETIDVPHPDGGDILVTVVGGPFAAERALDGAFLRELEGTDKPAGLLVGVPRRGLLMAMDAAQPRAMHLAFAAMVDGQFRRGESPPISASVFLVKSGHFLATLVETPERAGARESVHDDEPPVQVEPPAAPGRDESGDGLLAIGGCAIVCGLVFQFFADTAGAIVGVAMLILGTACVAGGYLLGRRRAVSGAPHAITFGDAPPRSRRRGSVIQLEAPRPEEPDIDDGAFASALIVRLDQGLRVDAMVGAPEASAVARTTTGFVLQLVAKHRWDPEFSGVIRAIVIPTLTPDTNAVRDEMDEAIRAVEGTIAERGWRTVNGGAITVSWERGKEQP